jgi:hypothetical protein
LNGVRGPARNDQGKAIKKARQNGSRQSVRKIFPVMNAGRMKIQVATYFVHPLAYKSPHGRTLMFSGETFAVNLTAL